MYTVPGSKGTRFMLVCNVALGNVKDYTKITPDLEQPPKGYHSVHGVRRTPEIESDFLEDEWVIYNTSQQMQQYLVEFAAASIKQNETPSSAPVPVEEKKAKVITDISEPKFLQVPKQKEQKLKEPKQSKQKSPKQSPQPKKLQFGSSPVVVEVEPYPWSSSAAPQSDFGDASQFAHPSAFYGPSEQFAQPQQNIYDYHISEPVSYQAEQTYEHHYEDSTYAYEQPDFAPSTFSSTFSQSVSEAPATSLSESDAGARIDTGYQKKKHFSAGNLNYSPVNTTELPRNLQEMKEYEDRLRELYAQNRDHPDIQDLYCNLIDVYQNRDTFKFEELDEGEVLLSLTP